MQRDHNLELPTWTETIGLDQLAILRNRFYAMNTETPYMTRVTAGPLIAEFVDKMTEWDSGVLTQKLLVYSAHDFNIIDVMNALNMSNQIDNYPNFGAALALELYRDDGPTTELRVNWSNWSWIDILFILKFCFPFLFRFSTMHIQK